jgi:hypothetical protein
MYVSQIFIFPINIPRSFSHTISHLIRNHIGSDARCIRSRDEVILFQNYSPHLKEVIDNVEQVDTTDIRERGRSRLGEEEIAIGREEKEESVFRGGEETVGRGRRVMPLPSFKKAKEEREKKE